MNSTRANVVVRFEGYRLNFCFIKGRLRQPWCLRNVHRPIILCCGKHALEARPINPVGEERLTSV